MTNEATAPAERIDAVRSGSFVLDVIDSGPLDGMAVVLLHGFPQRASTWAPTTRILNEAGLRTFALDQRGYSPGARPRGRRSYRVNHLIDDVVALIDRIGGPVTLVGHDWGSAVAWSVAMRRPDLVDRLITISVPHLAAFFASMVRSDQLVRSWYILFFQLPLLPEFASRRLGWMEWWLRRGGMPESAIDAWRRDFLDAGCLPGALGWYRALPFLRPSQVRPDITVPTTLIWSHHDKMLGGAGARMTRSHVSASFKLVELAGNTHWLMDEAPDVIAAEVLAAI